MHKYLYTLYHLETPEEMAINKKAGNRFAIIKDEDKWARFDADRWLHPSQLEMIDKLIKINMKTCVENLVYE